MVRFSSSDGLDADNLQLPNLFNTQIIERYPRFRTDLLWAIFFCHVLFLSTASISNFRANAK
jgi:hypothetical protein